MTDANVFRITIAKPHTNTVLFFSERQQCHWLVSLVTSMQSAWMSWETRQGLWGSNSAFLLQVTYVCVSGGHFCPPPPSPHIFLVHRMYFTLPSIQITFQLKEIISSSLWRAVQHLVIYVKTELISSPLLIVMGECRLWSWCDGGC